MADEIKPGSIVQLKSGGPTMTVNWVQYPNERRSFSEAYCEWFIEDKAPWKTEGRVFPLTSLKLLQP